MKKRVLSALLAVIMALALTACSVENKPNQDDVVSPSTQITTTQTGEASQSDTQTTEQAAADGKLMFKPYEEVAEGDFTNLYSDGKFGGEYLESYVFYSAADMTDVKVHSIEMNEDMTFTSTGLYYSADSIKSGDGLFLSINVPDVPPACIIVYKAAGKEYSYGVFMNGRDGGISLIEASLTE